jgi:PhzF family phenazine biosynthesis protein
MKLPVFQLDAFAGKVFGGNPAVVVCMEDWLQDPVLAAIAIEHNISTTAFLRSKGEELEIRYFLPTGELDLVGHASLAAAHVLLRLLRPDLRSATLRRRTGVLHVSSSDDGRVAITLPAVPAQPCAMPAGLAEALGVPIVEVRANAAQYFAVLESEAAVACVAPDMDVLLRLDRDGVIVTAPGRDCDFVSRAFAPKEGLPEDPVCGSAHLALVPFWSERLGRRHHRALQLSPRGGELHCSLDDDEVRLAGRCALYLEGTISGLARYTIGSAAAWSA